ncbi:hypothetical protein HZH66_005325 [Vespula vulgaris]|uniref:Uncharacterized protein n=1 Tax=Vespula vulgaris TaxID=7454 RepID=A0A834KAB1_VESVU|nr:hypothetical protein HZH66_005325 [Vespula vulgaris]
MKPIPDCFERRFKDEKARDGKKEEEKEEEEKEEEEEEEEEGKEKEKGWSRRKRPYGKERRLGISVGGGQSEAEYSNVRADQ